MPPASGARWRAGGRGPARAAWALALLLACARAGDPSAPQTPALAIAAPADDLTATNGVLQVRLAVSGVAPAAVQLLLDGAPLARVGPPYAYAWDTRPLPEATYELRAELQLGSETLASSPKAVVVDRTAPPPPAIDARVCAAGMSASVLTGTAEPSALVTLYEGTASLTSVTAGAAGRWTATLALAAGAHALSATAADAAGNVSGRSGAFAVTVDGSASQVPGPPRLTRPPPALTNYPSLFVEGVAVAGNTVDLYWDGAAARTFQVTQADGTWGVFVDVPQGTHAFTATQTSPAGCTSPPTPPLTVVADRSAPGAPVITTPVPGVVNAAGPAAIPLGGTADAGATIRAYAGSVFLASAQAGDGGGWSLTVATSDLPEGSYPLAATATDAAGNTSPEASTAALLVDRIPPAPPAYAQVPQVVNAASSTVALGGTAESKSTVNVYLGTALLGAAVADAGGSWSLALGASALPEGSYALTATATDAAGNTSAVATSAAVLVDRTPPQAPTLVAPDSAKVGVAFAVGGTAADEPGLTVRVYEGAGAAPLAEAAAAGGGWSASLSFGAAGTYTLTSTAVDAAGNASGPSAAVAVAVSP